MLRSISEILKEVSEQTKTEDKVRILHQNQDNTVLMGVLKVAFDDRIKFLLPEGAPPYKPSGFIDNQVVLYREWRKMNHFIEGMGFEHLDQKKREKLFVELLENVDKDDAILIISIKDKKIPYPGINKKLVNKAFPELLGD